MSCWSLVVPAWDGVVEVGHREIGVLVRDTKDREGSVIRFSPEAWQRFTTRLKADA
jgi:Domain of unknown function (DUF397)